MLRKPNRSIAICKVFIISTLTVISFNSLRAQNYVDTTKKLLLAVAEKRTEPRYLIKPSNVIFPEILQGNESEMLEYIEKFSKRRREYLIRMYKKGQQLLPKAATILSKYNLPTELKILLTLESAYNANAISTAGAVGYWQIMDEVAREYGLKYTPQLSETEKKMLSKQKSKTQLNQNKTIAKQKDDRKNFKLGTHTAARYLRDRRRNLDDNWLLVVASYNCGVGNVWKAMERSRQLNPTFWDISKYLPAETRTYVMNFITLNVIFHNYELFIKSRLNFTEEKIMMSEEMERCAPEDLTVDLDK